MTDFEATIIGAGVVGLSIARELSKNGKSVLVIEKRKREKPKDVVSGIISFEGDKIENYKPNYKPFFKNKYFQIINRILRVFNL